MLGVNGGSAKIGQRPHFFSCKIKLLCLFGVLTLGFPLDKLVGELTIYYILYRDVAPPFLVPPTPPKGEVRVFTSFFLGAMPFFQSTLKRPQFFLLTRLFSLHIVLLGKGGNF